MTVDVDKSRGQGQAAGVDDPGGLTVQMGGHGDEATLCNGHVRLESCGAGAIEDDSHWRIIISYMLAPCCGKVGDRFQSS